MKLNFKNIVEKVNEELIFKHITPEFIYFYYLNELPDTKKFYISPFGNEKSPSFRLRIRNGKLIFKCFSSGNSGDCIELVKIKESLSYQQALNFIYYSIILKQSSLRKLKKVSKDIQVEKSESKEHLIEVILREFNEFDLKYWQQYHINLELLNKYDIKPCKEVWTNKVLWYSDIRSNPCYRYLFNSKYKIYKPLEKDKKIKFNNNCNNEKNIQGINHLFDSDICFITKSYKDIIVLNEYIGIPSIALHGEGHIPPKSLMVWLQSKYKRIILFYDNDEPGIKASNKIKEFLKVEYNIEVEEIFIPDVFKKRAKDPSDFIKEYGIENLQSTIKYLINEQS